MQAALSSLQMLEAEAIYVIREMAAECRRPVMLYSAGKDSAVLLHLVRKAFHPASPPMPLLHIDTCWKFRAMYEHRDAAAAAAGMELIVHRNPEAMARGINPFDHGALHTEMWKTDGLKQALDAHGFDAALAGARRDEEASRSKERIVSVRAPQHRWDPRKQRPELWQVYNLSLGDGETLRVFPLSNWTEADVWRYIAAEEIAVAPLYFAAPRPTLTRNGMLIVPDDERMALRPGERIVERVVRFRTLGCYPLTGAVESSAASVSDILAELAASRFSERQGRAIDQEAGASMEEKKKAGYF